jgi:uncharacterized membrane protein YphA (DoxX/SURF4 family)
VRVASWSYWLLRIVIGVLVSAAGLGKMLDVPGFVEVMRTYQLLADGSLWRVAIGVVVFELVLGAWLLSGWRMPVAALLSATVHLGYAVLLTVSLLRGLELANCGCFGAFLARPLNWYSPLEDVALAGFSVALFALARLRERGSLRLPVSR